MESPTMNDSDALLLMVAGYIGRDVVPWLGARLVEAAKVGEGGQ
jgi:hypothetical protein